MSLLIKILATGLGAGYLPLAPGTFGTVLACAVYWFIFGDNPQVNFTLTLAFVIISIPVATIAEDLFARKDDKRIVIDEVVGFLVSMLFLPKTLIVVAAAFALFRFFDVVKPWFIKHSQALKGGLGIVMDDVLAGIFTNVILQLAIIIIRILFVGA